MKDLTYIVKESISNNISDFEYLFESYKNVTSEFKSLVKRTKLNEFEPSCIELIGTLINDIVSKSEYGDKMKFVYNTNSFMFKIPYLFADTITSVIGADETKNVYYKKDGVKVKVYMNGNGYDNRRRMIFQTGVGSVGKITTEEQESAFCLIWNTIKDQLIETNDTISINDLIRNVIGDISDRADDSWITSWYTSIQNLVSHLISKGKKPNNYTATRVSSNSNDIGKTHYDFVYKYGIKMNGKGTRKDVFDPSDVVLYRTEKKDKMKSIIEGFTSMLDSTNADYIKIKRRYFNRLIKRYHYIPISLKKISNGNDCKMGLMNVVSNSGNTCSVNGFTFDENDTNRVDVICDCNVCFTGQTDGNGNELTDKHGLVVVMRSFQKDNKSVDIDVTLNIKGAPTLGKCPRNIWRDILQVDKTTPKQEMIEKFKSLLNEKTSETNDKLKQIIQGAIKQGPSCFPFLLIH